MNFGTKLRATLAVLTTLNTVLAVTDVTQFGDEKLTMYYKITSVIINAVVVGINTWYNNDFTPTASEYTGAMRAEKARLRGEPDGLDIVIEDYIEDGDDNE